MFARSDTMRDFMQRPSCVWMQNTSKIVWTRHAGHCWRSKDEIVSDVLLWTPAYGQSKAGRPARTFIQQLCDDTGCNFEDLPEAMNDRETWRERVRDICASRTSWWWWWWWYSLLSKGVSRAASLSWAHFTLHEC